MYNFYALIIGSEILNGRREDMHFEFLKKLLSRYNHTLFASFIVKDDVELLEKSLELIKSDSKSILFSFGGIGSTPDDLTREIASKIFRSSPVETNKQFLNDIIERFGDKAYPHRVNMAKLPPSSQLIKNPINNMSGFSIDERFFFVPGFPNMSHPMITSVVEDKFSTVIESYRLTILAQTSEESLISEMNKTAQNIELSSLPMFKDNRPLVELSLCASSESDVKDAMEIFVKRLEDLKVSYRYI
ncbi:MAG: molybdopterin-binding protein [Campylobacterota bacterium]|nr:molybdopterin-binding protein [Campylobacterota bacterium]